MLNQKVLSSLQSSLIDGTFNFLSHVCRQASQEHDKGPLTFFFNSSDASCMK